MYLIKRQPRVDVDVPRLMNRFFNDFWESSFGYGRDWDEDSTVWSPRIDLSENKDGYEILADRPGKFTNIRILFQQTFGQYFKKIRTAFH